MDLLDFLDGPRNPKDVRRHFVHTRVRQSRKVFTSRVQMFRLPLPSQLCFPTGAAFESEHPIVNTAGLHRPLTCGYWCVGAGAPRLNGGMKRSTARKAKTPTAASASASASSLDPATSWAESLGGGAGEDAGRLGRQTCWAVWQEDLAAFEVQQPRGDYLRSMVSSFVCNWRRDIGQGLVNRSDLIYCTR